MVYSINFHRHTRSATVKTSVTMRTVVDVQVHLGRRLGREPGDNGNLADSAHLERLLDKDPVDGPAGGELDMVWPIARLRYFVMPSSR
jgi:hypothetical protein